MKSFQYIVVFVLIVFLAACGRTLPDETPAPPATEVPDVEPTVVADADAEAPVDTTTEEPETVAQPAEPVDPIVTEINQADVTNGETLFNQLNDTGFACSSCHNPNNEEQLIGPGLYNIPLRASQRVEGQIAQQYIYNSIVHPNDYIVEGYPENLMPQNYEEIFTTDEIYDITAYLMTLGAQPEPAQAVAAAPTEASDTADAPVDDVVSEETPETAVAEPTTEMTEPTEVETDVAQEPAPQEPAPIGTVIPTLIPVRNNALDSEMVVSMARLGIPSYGERLFNEAEVDGYTCADCHYADSTEVLEAAGLEGIASRVQSQITDQEPELYLYNVIVDPSVHGELADEYGDTFGFSQVYDIIAYLMTLESEPVAAEVVPAPAEPEEVVVETEPEAMPTEAPAEEAAAQEEAPMPAEEEDPLTIAINNANAGNGETLFNELTDTGFACSSCHNVNSQERLIGPGLLGIPSVAAERVEGQGTYEYLYNSILHPNDYIVTDYPENLMPATYEEVFTMDEIYDIVAYLLTLE